MKFLLIFPFLLILPNVGLQRYTSKSYPHTATEDVVAMTPLPRLPGDLITPKQAAKILQCHPVTVYRYIHLGMLPAYRRGRMRFFVSQADIAAFVHRIEIPSMMIRSEGEEAAIKRLFGE